jgi:transposase
MHDGFNAVTPDGVSLNIESGFRATKDYRRADNSADANAGERGGAVLFRKIANPRSSQKHAIRLSSGDRSVLEQLTRSRVRPHRHVVRSHIVLLAHGGSSVARIAMRLGVAPSTVRRWCRRFVEGGVHALLNEAPGRGRPRGINQRIVLAVLRAARVNAAVPMTIRRIAARAGTSASRVWRIFSRYGLHVSSRSDLIDAAIERVISETHSRR